MKTIDYNSKLKQIPAKDNLATTNQENRICTALKVLIENKKLLLKNLN